MASADGTEDNNARTIYVPGTIEHEEAAKEMIRAVESLSQTTAFIVNNGYNQAVILGDTKVRRVNKDKYAFFNVSLRNEQTRRKGWRFNTQRPISAKNWRTINNAMKNLTTHQDVGLEEYSRKYEAITEGPKGKRLTVFHFWFSLAIVNLEKKDNEKDEEYLEVVIDLELQRKLTTGWNQTERLHYGILSTGIRVIGDISHKNEDLESDEPLEIYRETDMALTSGDEDADTDGEAVVSRKVDLQAKVEYVPSPINKLKPKKEINQNLSLYNEKTPMGISRASSSTPNQYNDGSNTSKDTSGGDATITQEDSPAQQPKKMKILVEGTQSQSVINGYSVFVNSSFKPT